MEEMEKIIEEIKKIILETTEWWHPESDSELSAGIIIRDSIFWSINPKWAEEVARNIYKKLVNIDKNQIFQNE